MGDEKVETATSAGKLPPLVMLRAFEAAGRTGSMRRAADDIGVSHTVVSRHVRNLELWMGRKLVLTGPRGVQLTAEGETLLAAISKGFGIIIRTTAELRPRWQSGRLRIWCIAGLATRWLTPRLSELEEALGGGVDIELRATDAKPDLTRREADILIGYGVTENLPDGAVTLVKPRMFPVASPKWLESHVTPGSPSELSRFPLIHEINHLQWSNWFEALGETDAGPLSGLRLSDASISFDAALAGQGIALVNELMASDELRRGQLVELFQTHVELGTYYLQHAAGRSADPIIRDFKAWIGKSINRALPAVLS